MSDMPQGSTHHKCTLKKKGKQMTVYFSQGSGYYGEDPSVFGVLSCLISDAASLNCVSSIADFAEEFGYSYLKAEKVYNTIEKQTEKLKKFLGSDFDYFMYEVENDY
jgi:hypothetical protein